MQKKTALEKITWLKDQRMIGRFRCENPSENQDLSTLINQVILALGKPEPLAKKKAVIKFCKNCNSGNLAEEKIYRCKDCRCFHDKSGAQL